MPLVAWQPGASGGRFLANPHVLLEPRPGVQGLLTYQGIKQSRGFWRRFRARNIAPGFRRDVTEQTDRKVPISVKAPQLVALVALPAAVVGSAYPTTPIPTRINGETLEFRDERVQFSSPYNQTWLFSGQDHFRRILLAYVSIAPADRDALRTHWRGVKGMVGTFPFTHPVSGEIRTMRYARQPLEWDHDPEPGHWAGAPVYSLEVELIEAP